MANSLPFNAVAVDGEYDRVYKAEDWAWYFATFIANGIFPKPSDGLQVVAYSGMEIRVNAGYAFINGYAFRNPATLSVTLDTAEGALNRVDRVVVRWDLPQRDMYIAVLKGTPSAKPTATAVTRTTEIWELALADIYVGKGVTRIQTQNITDQRFNSAVCGIVTGTVEEIDASVLTKQFTDFFNTYSAAVLDEFSAYKQSMESNGIVPRSVWTLGHRPKCSPEGMVYLGGGTWVDIYLNSDDGAKGLKSEYGCAPMTGTESMNWYNFVERLAKSGKRLPNYAEFCAYVYNTSAHTWDEFKRKISGQAETPQGGNEKTIWNFLTGKGLNAYAVAGIMGNLYAESGLMPNNLQNTYNNKLGKTDAEYTAAVDNGSYGNFVKDSAGYGLAQWTYWSRKQALLNHAKQAGVSIADLNMQLGFLWEELQGYTAVMDALKKAGSVRAASDAVLTGYEKPADQSETVKKKRAEYGEGYYKKYAAGNGTKYYRVRKSWTDAASQLGAFTSLENAKSACKAGYTVYDDNGKAVYTAAGQQTSAGVPFSVQVDILDLNIRTGAGTNYAKTGETTGKGVFTIVEVKAGQGASAGWGRLKSGAGWISLDYATRLA